MTAHNRKFLRLPQLRAKLGPPGVPVGVTTIYRWMKEGDFPRPIKLGRRVALWDEAEIDAWLAKSPRYQPACIPPDKQRSAA